MTKTIGDIIRDLRISRNLTQEQLAENLNLTAQAISKWENHIGLPDIAQVVPIARFFGVSTDVLFGLAENTAADEVQMLIDNAAAQESYAAEYALLREALQAYPGNIRLLSELLACGACLLADGDAVKEPERTQIYAACERAGKLILTYSEALNVRLEASSWLVKLYCEVGELEKAAALAEQLPEQVGFNRNAALAQVCETEQQYAEAAAHNATNAAQHMRQLMHALILCANLHARAGDKQASAAEYACAAAVGEAFLRTDLFPTRSTLREYLRKSVERCGKNLERLKNSAE